MFLKALPLLFSALLALPLLANATDRSMVPCTPGDDPDYSWPSTFKNNGRTYLYNCAFLSNPTNPVKQQRRINNWCPQTVDGIKIKDKCRAACNNPCPDEPTTCVPKSSKWNDKSGNSCDWYATDPETRCGPPAERFANYFGRSANWNCCVCGGGSKEAQKMVECVDTRQRDNLGWVFKGPGFYSFQEAKIACQGYKYLSIECPVKNVGFEVFCLKELGLQWSRQIMYGECMNDLSDTSLNGADNGYCNGPYFDVEDRVWLGGWHRGAVYLVDPDEKVVTEDEDEVVGTLESGIIMEKKQQAAY